MAKTKLGTAPKTQIDSNKELRDDLRLVYQELRTGKIGLKEAKEFANLAGKIVSSAKAQMDYNAATGNGRKIDFFEC